MRWLVVGAVGVFSLGCGGPGPPDGGSGGGGYGLVGTITVTHLDATSSAGSFSTTMSMVDGGSSALSGSWDTVNCP
jgi:hypothetical protein